MLKQRLIYGTSMIVALVVIFALDNRLDQVELTGTIWQKLFLGRDFLPAGLLMLGMFVSLIVFGSRELCGIARAKNIPADIFIITLAGFTGCVLIYIIPNSVNSQVATTFVATLMTIIFLLALVKHSFFEKRTQGALAAGGVAMLAFVYLGMMPGLYLAIRRWHSAWVVAGVILVTKSCDIGAYFTGRAIGKHKLIPWLSPGKTVEGLVGGVMLSAIVATILAAIGNNMGVSVATKDVMGQRGSHLIHFNLVAAFIGGALIGLVGHFGDLIASLFKRDAGIKDSGNTIPGFGGLIDLVDSPLAVAPLAYWLIWFAGR